MSAQNRTMAANVAAVLVIVGDETRRLATPIGELLARPNAGGEVTR